MTIVMADADDDDEVLAINLPWSQNKIEEAVHPSVFSFRWGMFVRTSAGDFGHMDDAIYSGAVSKKLMEK